MNKLFFILLLALSYPSFAKKQDNSMIDSFHTNFSGKILNFSESIDNFFVDSTHEKLTNKSKVKVGFLTYFRESKGTIVTPDFNYQLVLPNTEKKLQLVISSDKGDNDGKTSRASRQIPASNKKVIEETAAGLRYILSTAGVQLYTTTGVIISVPVKLFTKLSLKKNIPLSKKWVQRISQNLKWVNTDGVSSNFNWDLDRSLTKKTLFRFVNNIYWDNYSVNNALQLKNGPSLFHQIDKDKAISLHLHVNSTNEPHWEVSSYTVQASYRRRIFKKWLYMEVSPFLNFPRTDNFFRNPGLFLEIEGVFGYLK